MTTAASHVDEQRNRVERILAELDNLPTLPAVATRVLELTSASESSAREVVRLIESDQSLTAKLFRLASRAGSGMGRNVNTVEKIVLFMGFEAVRNAVLSIKVFEVFSRSGAPGDTQFDHSEFWKHSLAVACAAQLAAESRTVRVEPEQAFVCGLLHDLGKVALDACLPKSYERVIARTDATNGCIADVERDVLGVDHTVVGHRLAQKWHFPAAFAECVWLHHNGPDAIPASVSHPREIQLVHFADRLAREMRIGYSGNYLAETSAWALAQHLGLSRTQYDEIVGELVGRIEKRAHLIGLDRLTSRELYIQALTEANDELSRANATLGQSNRELSRRAQCFAALRSLNLRMGETANMPDVCVLAAGAMRQLVQSSAAAVFAFSGSGLLHVGLSRDHDEQPNRTMSWDAAGFERPAWWPTRANASPASFTPAAPALPDLVDRVQADGDAILPWLYPLVTEPDCTAGILLAGPDDAPTLWGEAGEEIAAVACAMGQWLSNVEAQARAQRLNEDLADINRRLQHAQQEAARVRSLSMVAEMASGAAHELNNPLAVISGRAQMLAARPPDEATARIATVLAEQAQRCSQIVAELMDFAKPQDPHLQLVSVRTLLGRIRERWLERSALTPEQFRLELSDDAPTVLVDVEQVSAAFDEVIRNALEAMDDHKPSVIINFVWNPTDDRVAIRVTDTGRGMDADVAERAVDPFFSHRRAGRGRGLGLSRALRWIEINGGRMRLHSRKGESTTVIVEFPVAGESGLQ
jgi:putative nucleotidyltransferase with HDIG domain